jgi:hypothetical protein
VGRLAFDIGTGSRSFAVGRRHVPISRHGPPGRRSWHVHGARELKRPRRPLEADTYRPGGVLSTSRSVGLSVATT